MRTVRVIPPPPTSAKWKFEARLTLKGQLHWGMPSLALHQVYHSPERTNLSPRETKLRMMPGHPLKKLPKKISLCARSVHESALSVSTALLLLDKIKSNELYTMISQVPHYVSSTTFSIKVGGVGEMFLHTCMIPVHYTTGTYKMNVTPLFKATFIEKCMPLV